MKSLEQRLFHAYQNGYRLSLSSSDVLAIVRDDAIGTRITNEAAKEAGLDPPGNCSVGVPKNQSWAAFKKLLKAASE